MIQVLMIRQISGRKGGPRWDRLVCDATHSYVVSITPYTLRSVDGIIVLDIFEGSVTKEQFLQFLEEQVVYSSDISRDSLHADLL